MLSTGFEPAIGAIKRVQAYMLDRTGTGIINIRYIYFILFYLTC